MSSEKNFIFERKGSTFKACSFLFFFSFVLIIAMSFASARGVCINCGVVNPFQVGNLTQINNITVFNLTVNSTFMYNQTQPAIDWAIAQNASWSSTYNATYHSVFLSTGVFNSTFNATYHSVFLSTGVFNSTFNTTYHSVFLSTGAFNSTFNSTYAAYNTSTGLAAFYIMRGGDNISGFFNATRSLATNDINMTGTLWIGNINLSTLAGNVSTANSSLDSLLLSTGVFNSTFNATYHSVFLSTGFFNSTFNTTYHSVFLSTGDFNSTFNTTYHSVFLSTGVFNSTFNASYEQWNYNQSQAAYNMSMNNASYLSTFNDTYHSVFLSTGAFNSTFNVSYDAIFNQQCPAGEVVNGTLANGSFTCIVPPAASFNTTYHSVFLSTGVFNSTFNSSYEQWNYNQTQAAYNLSMNNASYLSTFNDTYHSVFLSTGAFNSTFNTTYHSVFLSTGVFNSTFNSSYEQWNYNQSQAAYNMSMNNASYLSTFNDTYHSVFLSTGAFNSTFNATYHSVFLSTGVFNSTFNFSYEQWNYNQTGVLNYTFNATYHSVFLSTGVFNSTFNATYAAYNTSTGLSAFYVPYTGAIKSVDLGKNNISVNNLTMNGSINLGDSFSATGITNLMHFATAPYGNATADGFRLDWNPSFEAANDDWLLFMKTDGNDIQPDGGIGFGYINTSGYNATVLRIYFDGNRIDSALNFNLTNHNLTDADWIFGKINFSDVQNSPGSFNSTYDQWAYNQTGVLNYTFNATYHSVFLSTGVFNSTFNASYEQWNYNQTGVLNYTFNTTYHSIFLSTGVFNSTFNDTYHSVFLSTGVFNSTFNITYDSVFLSTGVFNSTFNTTYHNYNTSTGLAAFYVKKSGDNITGNINMSGNNISGINYINPGRTPLFIGGNLTINGNLTTDQFIMGQPLTGMLGSGLIESTQSSGFISGINLTCTGLSCSYNSFRVRLASTTSDVPAKYCNITAGTITAADNTFSAFYVDSNCAIQSTTYDNWYTNMLGKTQAWDFAHVLAHGGTVEINDAISLEQKRLAKARVLTYYLDQASVVSGFNFQPNAWPYFNITSGKTVFGMDVVNVDKKNVTATEDLIEWVGHNQSSAQWQFVDGRGINVTSCDNGTDVVLCTGNNWRRHFIFIIGYDDEKNKAEVHQLFPLQSTTYASATNCLDTVTSPLTFTMPDEYNGANMMLYAYCAQRTTTTWVTTNLIDLRIVKTGTATSGTDTSGLVPYTGANQNVNLASFNISAATIILSGNLNMSGGNITQVNYINPFGSQLNSRGNISTIGNITADWHYGKFNITTDPYFFFNGTTLNFNGTYLNTTLGFYNDSYHNSSIIWNQTSTGRIYPFNLTARLGLGTQTPTSLLYVNGTTSNSLATFMSQDNLGTIATFSSEASNGIVTIGRGNAAFSSNGPLDVGDAGGISATFTNNVGIATASPTNELTVVGDANVTGIFYVSNISGMSNKPILFLSPINSSNNITTTANISADWLFGNITINSIVDYPGSYNATYHSVFLSTGIFNSTFNATYHSVFLSTGVFNSTFNSSYEQWNYNQTGVLNYTFNTTYHSIFLSTATFNSTFNTTYHSVFLSTATFNSTFNDTYHNILKSINSTYVLKTGDNITGFLNVTQNISVGQNLTVAGWVGIGASPATTLHVNSSSTILRLESGGDNNVLLRFNSNSVAKAQISYRASDDALTISHSEGGVSVGANYNLVIKEGLIGIGTATPTQNLTVIGQGNFTGNLTTTIISSFNQTFSNATNIVWRTYVNASGALITEYVG